MIKIDYMIQEWKDQIQDATGEYEDLYMKRLKKFVMIGISV